jgi:hypothetical protein
LFYQSLHAAKWVLVVACLKPPAQIFPNNEENEHEMDCGMARKMKTAHPDKNCPSRKPKGFGGRSVIVEELRCETVVKVEQTTQAFGFDDRAGSGPGPGIGERNDVVESLTAIRFNNR